MKILGLGKNSTSDSTSGISYFEQEAPLSKWAADFIKSHQLSRETFASQEVFTKLSRRQKDAIRYQLRKNISTLRTPKQAVLRGQNFITPSRRTAKRPFPLLLGLKITMGVWISGFLLLDVVQIYRMKGASSLMAWQTAILVELCIVSAALSSQRFIQRIAYALFAYNVLLFAFMQIDQALVMSVQMSSVATLTQERKAMVHEMKVQLSKHIAEGSVNLKRLNIDHAKGFVTSGAISFEKVTQTLNHSNSVLMDNIQKLEREVSATEEGKHSFTWIYATSALYFLLRCLLQLFSIKLIEAKKEHTRAIPPYS